MAKQSNSWAALRTRDEEFVRAWQSHACIGEVSEAMGLDASQIKVIAKRLRLNGVQLKTMPRSPRGAGHYARLRELCDSLNPPR